MERLRKRLRASQAWIRFQELNREGWAAAASRARIQRRILATAPIRTDREGDTEVRVLTWRRDYLNALWALKSFYAFSGTRAPLHLHDGGLSEEAVAILLQHFPDATIVHKLDADRAVEGFLGERGYARSLAYRRENIATLKLFDFFVLSRARRVISIDSDIVFYRSPRELLDPEQNLNVFNRDCQEAYSLSLGEVSGLAGVSVPARINSGLSNVVRGSVDFERIEMWLGNEALFRDKWVTEQTLHAMSAARAGVGFLPETYQVGTEAGLRADAVCKHYPGFFRPLLYQEGFAALLAKTDFISRCGGAS